MAIQGSGEIGMLDIVAEFGGTAPHGLNEYYGASSGVPASGTIDMADFYGATNGPNVTYLGTTMAVGNCDNLASSALPVTITLPAADANRKIFCVAVSSLSSSTIYGHSLYSEVGGKFAVSVHIQSANPPGGTEATYAGGYSTTSTWMDMTAHTTGLSGAMTVYVKGYWNFNCQVHWFSYTGTRVIADNPYNALHSYLNKGGSASQTYCQPAGKWDAGYGVDNFLRWWPWSDGYSGDNANLVREGVVVMTSRITGGGTRACDITRTTVGTHDASFEAYKWSDGWAMAWGTFSEHTALPTTYPVWNANDPAYSGENLTSHFIALI